VTTNMGLCGALLVLWLSACAAPPAEVPPNSHVWLAIERAPGRLRLEVSITHGCSQYNDWCNRERARPIERVAVMIRVNDRLRELGLTDERGFVDVELKQFDALFPVEATSKWQRAKIEVNDHPLASLDVGEIVHRHKDVAGTIEQALTLLAMSDEALRNYEQGDPFEVMSNMLYLQMQGLATPELMALSGPLSERLRILPDDWGPRTASEEESAPWLERAIDMLPTVCKIGAIGTLAAAKSAVTGPARVVLELVVALFGDKMAKSLSEACGGSERETLSPSGTTKI
jgi:hypothetical protein